MGGGGGKGGDAPSAPDYAKLAQQQGQEERKTAEAITASNRPTQNNPFGSISWSQAYSPEQQSRVDAINARLATVRKGSAAEKKLKDELSGMSKSWTQNETWDPRITESYDRLFDMNKAAQEDLAGAGPFQGGPEMPQYDEAYRKQYEQDMYDSVMNRARPEQEQKMAQFTTKLRQQGLQPGTAAYDRAMQNLMTSQGDVNTQAALNARMAGGEQARQEYTTALAGQNQAYGQAKDIWGSKYDAAGAMNNLIGSQYRPQFQGFGTATGYSPADMAGAAQQQYQTKMGGYNAQQGKKGSTMNAGFSALGGMF